jgi:CDP-6-deoxy-D-xylo-4-hexulose-3-dehydrase
MCFPLVVRPEAPFSREDLHRHLEARGIVSRPIWTGNILHHPGFAELRCRRAAEGYPVSDSVLRGGLLVASHHGLDAAQVARIHTAFAEFLAANP